MMIKRKILIKNEKGEVVQSFDSVKQAAQHFGISATTMSYRAKTDYTKDGFTTCYETNRMPLGSKKKWIPKNYRFQDDNTELDRDKYAIVKYEVVHKRICITPCPFKRAPKPLVGSASCLICSSFKGRNINSHEVACSNLLSKVPMN